MSILGDVTNGNERHPMPHGFSAPYSVIELGLALSLLVLMFACGEDAGLSGEMPHMANSGPGINVPVRDAATGNPPMMGSVAFIDTGLGRPMDGGVLLADRGIDRRQIDMGQEPDLPDVDPMEAGIRYVQIQTSESPSWVAWSEVEILVGERNLAPDSDVSASNTAADSDLAYLNDAQYETSWNSGDFAPTVVTFDLGAVYSVSQIRLLVSQTPPGPTVHALRLAGQNGMFSPAHTWRESTQAGDWLVWQNDPQAAPEMPQPELPNGLSRGLRWVRTNPMFISGLTVHMPAPTPEQSRAYFEDFGANAVHLWSTGLPNGINDWRNSLESPPRFVSWTQSDGRSLDGQEVIGGFGANEPGRIGYQIGDEPMNMEEYLPIEAGLAAIRQVDPDALLIVNFSFWAEGLDEILNRFGEADADVVSFDTYTMGRSLYDRMGIFRTAGLQMGRPYWCYLVGYGEAQAPRFPHPTGMRWAAMAHATYGYTGYTWFLYQVNVGHNLLTALFEETGRFDSPRTALYATAAQLNRELTVLGRTLTQLTSTAVRYVTALGPLAQPPGTENWVAGDGADPYLTAVITPNVFQDVVLGFFRDDRGGRYFMIQNPNHRGGTFPTDSEDEAVIQLEFDIRDDGVSGDHLQALDVLTGGIERVALEDTETQAKRLTVRIPAGDARLFKYSSDTPFAVGP